jgi:2'-hydroxyisoflavone reductase
MKFLIIGGTRFLGRALVEAALDAGHELTLFNRGQSNPDLYPQLEHVRGNRDGGLDALRGRQWDAVLDTCGYVPRLVGDSARLLADTVEHYTFISSISVYQDFDKVGLDESYTLATMPDETVEEVTGETYGPLKVLCEQTITAAMNGRALHVRAGLIVGPHDPTDRFSYWPYRLAQGGDVLAPGNPDTPVQIIDVRDLAAWTVQATAQKLRGPFNATGPAYRLTMRDVLQTCGHIADADADITWVDEAFLLEQGVAPWTDLPLWVAGEEAAGFSTVDCAKAQQAGLTYRPLADTVRDTLDWLNTRPADYAWRNGLTREREAALLNLWRDG